MAVHRLEPTPETVTQFFSRDTPAVLTVDPGDTLVVQTLDARGHASRAMGVDGSRVAVGRPQPRAARDKRDACFPAVGPGPGRTGGCKRLRRGHQPGPV